MGDFSVLAAICCGQVCHTFYKLWASGCNVWISEWAPAPSIWCTCTFPHARQALQQYFVNVWFCLVLAHALGVVLLHCIVPLPPFLSLPPSTDGWVGPYWWTGRDCSKCPSSDWIQSNYTSALAGLSHVIVLIPLRGILVSFLQV